MKDERTLEEFIKQNGIGAEDVLILLESITQAFPIISSVNLTQNTYTVLWKAGLMGKEVVSKGAYDDLFNRLLKNIHPTYQKLFQDSFSRDNLLHQFGQGRSEVHAKLYQKIRNNQYQWVSTRFIRVQERDEDVCVICIVKILDDVQNNKERIGRDYY